MHPGIELARPFPLGVEDHRREADRHVDRDHDDRDRDGADREGDERSPLPRGQECYDEPDRGLRIDRDVRRLVHGVGARERPRKDPVASHRVDDPRRRIDAGVRVRQGRVDDREENEHPTPAPEDDCEVLPGIRRSRRHLREVAETRPDHPGVGAEDVEQADSEGREDNGARDRPAGTPSLLAQRRRRLEADEGQDGEHHPLEDAVVRACGRMRRVERLEGEIARIGDQHPRGEGDKDADLEDAEHHAGLGREADVAVGQEEDNRRRDDDPDPPLPRVVPAEPVLVRADDIRGRPGEDEKEQRRDEWLEEEERPADHEPGPGAERACDVRVQASRRGNLLRHLANRAGDEDARDEGKEDRQWQRRSRELHREENRERDRGSGSHVRDRLEQDLRQPNRALPQMVEGTSWTGACFHRLASCALDYPAARFSHGGGLYVQRPPSIVETTRTPGSSWGTEASCEIRRPGCRNGGRAREGRYGPWPLKEGREWRSYTACPRSRR